MFRESIATFIQRSVVPSLTRFREQGKIDREFWEAAGSQGFLGIGIPAELGGGGNEDFRFNAVMNEELSRVALALASAIQIHVDIVIPYIVDLAGPPQRSRWL